MQLEPDQRRDHHPAQPAREHQVGTVLRLSYVFLAASGAGVLAGVVARVSGLPDLANLLWAITTAVGILPMAWSVAVDLMHRETGVDLIALLAMGGALALGEYLAGAIVVMMLSTGQSLEAYADGRAHRELPSLLERAPRSVSRYRGADLETAPIDSVVAGDRLMVKQGEVVPVGGIVQADGGGAEVVLDESALTGESRPVDRVVGDVVRSGAVNAGSPFDVRAIATAEDSA